MAVDLPNLPQDLLTALLRERLRAGARVIWVSSGGMYSEALAVDDLQYAHGEFGATSAYARTKRMQVVLVVTAIKTDQPPVLVA